MRAQINDRVLKLVLLGESGGGKSSIAKRYTESRFDPQVLPTIGLDYASKRVPLDDDSGGVLRVQIWDTAGQERFRSIASTYYRAGHITAIVFDASVREHTLEYWRQQVERNNPHTHLVAFANKRDLADGPHATRAGIEWCEQRGIPVFPMSAKTGAGVQEAFDAAVAWARSHLGAPGDSRSTLELQAAAGRRERCC